jgi:hypothetical protein
MQNSFLHKNGNLILVLVASFIMVLHFLFFHGGYFGYDDIEYAQIADSIKNNTFDYRNNLYAFRWTVVVPLAFIYWLFGTNDFANALFTWIPLIAILCIVLNILKNHSFIEKLIAVLFLVFSPIHLMYLEKPMPDIWVELGFLLAYFSYARTLENEKQHFANALVFAAGIIILFLAKESFLIFYPFFICLFFIDIYKKRNKRYWIILISVLTLFILFYFVFFWLKTGQPLARINALFSNQYLNECSYDKLPVDVLIDRLISGFWFCVIRYGFLLPIGFLFAVKRDLSKQGLLLFSILCLLFLSNFMSISYSAYVPMCPDPRHFMFLLPLLAILFSNGIKSINSSNMVAFAIAIILQLYLSVQNQFENSWLLFLPIIVGLIVFYFTKSKFFLGILFSIGLFAPFFQNAKYNAGLNYNAQKQLNQFILKQPLKDAIIVSDQVQVNIGNFYLKFDTLTTKYIPFDRMEKIDSTSSQPVYLIINGLTSYLSGNQWENLPVYVQEANKNSKLLLKNKGGELYSVLPK